MATEQCKPWWSDIRWTLGLVAVMAVLNLGLFGWAPQPFQGLIDYLEYDRQAILHGEVWRLLTGNLVHWSLEHFFLDVGVFLVVGLLYERYLTRWYPWLMLGTATLVGIALLLFQPDLAVYRGLSGVDSGQFAAALCVEFALSRQEKQRLLWVAPAAVVFFAKIAFECFTGRLFFGTGSLGDVGEATPLAHAAGVAAALAIMLVMKFNPGDEVPTAHAAPEQY